MKLLILSDVHANPYALDAIWAKESDCDAIYCTGDLVDYGPFPVEVIRWFREHNVKCVLGNHDAELIEFYEKYNGDTTGLPSEEYCWIHDNINHLSREDIDYLKALPLTMDFTADGYYYRMSHMYNDRERPLSIKQFDDYVAQIPLQRTDLPVRLIFGHSHRQAICQFRGDKLWFNPGSASYRRPDDPEKSAHYAVIENGVISLRAVEYCRKPLLKATLKLALEERMRENQLRVAFFFFGSAVSTRIPVEDSIQQALKDLAQDAEEYN